MSGKTITRVDLSEAIYTNVGLSRNECSEFVDSILLHISDTLARGEDVKISSFGTFLIRDKSSRLGRNPKTGEDAEISARRVLSFRASSQFKARVASREPEKS